MQITLDEIYAQFGKLQIERNAAVAESTRLEGLLTSALIELERSKQQDTPQDDTPGPVEQAMQGASEGAPSSN